MGRCGRKPYGYGAKERKVVELIASKRRKRKGANGPTPYNKIAVELNAEGFLTRDGKSWRAQQVRKVLRRLEANEQPKKQYAQKTSLNSTDFLSLEQIKQCRQAIGDPLERMVFELLLGTGLRASELCALTIRDIDLNKRQVDVRRGKGCKQRSVQISEELAEQLREYLKKHRYFAGRCDPVFLNKRWERLKYTDLRYRFRKLGKKCDILTLHPHALRHTFATILYNSSGDLKFVREQLGHNSMDTTAIYAKISPERRLQYMNDFGKKVGPREVAV